MRTATAVLIALIMMATSIPRTANAGGVTAVVVFVALFLKVCSETMSPKIPAGGKPGRPAEQPETTPPKKDDRKGPNALLLSRDWEVEWPLMGGPAEMLMNNSLGKANWPRSFGPEGVTSITNDGLHYAVPLDRVFNGA